MNNYMGDFGNDILMFNNTFKMSKVNGFDPTRLQQFVSILKEEIDEHQDIEDTVGLADWLGDIIVYCASELMRHSIDPSAVVCIIMDSNFSKLDDNGKPIFDSRNKLLKGPHFVAPEPMIAEYLDHYQIGNDHSSLTEKYPFREDVGNESSNFKEQLNDQRHPFRDNIEADRCEPQASSPGEKLAQGTEGGQQ